MAREQKRYVCASYIGSSLNFEASYNHAKSCSTTKAALCSMNSYIIFRVIMSIWCVEILMHERRGERVCRPTVRMERLKIDLIVQCGWVKRIWAWNPRYPDRLTNTRHGLGFDELAILHQDRPNSTCLEKWTRFETNFGEKPSRRR